MIDIQGTKSWFDAFLDADAAASRASELGPKEAFDNLWSRINATFYGPSVRWEGNFAYGRSDEERLRAAERLGKRLVFRRDLYETPLGAVVAIIVGDEDQDEPFPTALRLRFFVQDTDAGLRIVSFDHICRSCRGNGCAECDRGWKHRDPSMGYYGPKISVGDPVVTERENRPGPKYVAQWER